MSRIILSAIAISSMFLLIANMSQSSPERKNHKKEEAVFIQPTPCSEDGDPWTSKNTCLGCHQNIEPIRCTNSQMFQDILQMAEQSGTNNRCVVCHGGNPMIQANGVTPKSQRYLSLSKLAHRGTPKYFETHPGPKSFYPDPGSPWINKNSCGVCHGWEVEAQWKSLMMTEAGKIQGTVWGFGGLSGYKHQWANYDVADSTGRYGVMGTRAFKDYLANLSNLEPNVFVEAMTEVPKAPVGSDDIAKNPSASAFTYIRGECQRCHLGVRGVQRFGDYRGYGCSACHIPYSNSGHYEGADVTIDKTTAGHPLVHRIQSTHDSPVKTENITFSGIPVETCTTCHNRGRRIGVSFQGLMETAYQSPWTDEGKPQQKIHGKNYLHLKSDLHNAKGFVCQDCHTSLDVHSPNKLIGAITAAVEIECFDCHGTPEKFPWELPLGFGDEYDVHVKSGAPRGITKNLPTFMNLGKVYPVEDGYLLSARGNPLGNAIRSGDSVKVYLASGEVKMLSPLKFIAENNGFDLDGRVAMVQVADHIEKLECYACHSTWAPQCYGCHVKIDYTKEKAHNDWIEIGKAHLKNGTTTEYTTEAESLKLNGEIKETRSYLRWEEPALALNGEGRISPVIPGCQTTVTVIDKNGNAVLSNHIFRVKNVEGAGDEGQLAIDMSPLDPHTVQKKARNCVSCHESPKALGYGIQSGNVYGDPSQQTSIDLTTADGKLIPKNTRPQFSAIANLSFDWSRFVTKDGQQLQTVGHHLRLSRPLNNQERAHISREGTCLACHQEIPNNSIAVNLLHHIAETSGLMPEATDKHFGQVHKTLLISGWAQIIGIIGLLLGLGVLLRKTVRRRGA